MRGSRVLNFYLDCRRCRLAVVVPLIEPALVGVATF